MVLIGIDPQSDNTAVTVDTEETALAELTVKADRHQVERLLKWAIDFRSVAGPSSRPTGSRFLLAVAGASARPTAFLDR